MAVLSDCKTAIGSVDTADCELQQTDQPLRLAQLCFWARRGSRCCFPPALWTPGLTTLSSGETLWQHRAASGGEVIMRGAPAAALAGRTATARVLNVLQLTVHCISTVTSCLLDKPLVKKTTDTTNTVCMLIII